MNESINNESESSIEIPNTSPSPTNSLNGLSEVLLGDVIQLMAPQNPAIDKQIYYVFYINDQKLKLLNTSSHQLLKLNIADSIADKTIIGVELLSRSELLGFAKQHKLEPPQWIDVHFGGDMPTVLSGEITNLEEDMIEITTYPGMRVIYIDFAYQGIPEELPIERIVLRDRPKALQTSIRSMLGDTTDATRDEVESEPTVEIDAEDGQQIITIPENVSMNPSPAEIVEEFIRHDVEIPRDDADSDAEEELASMTRLFDVPESERRYSEEMQTADLLGELVSKLAPEQRTSVALKDIHKFVTRFKELRREFSVFDSNGDVIQPKQTDMLHKPLIRRILNLDSDLKWLLPVVYERNELMEWSHLRGTDDYDDAITHVETSMHEFMAGLQAIESEFKDAQQTETNRYDKMVERMDSICSPAFGVGTTQDLPEDVAVYIANRPVQTGMEFIVSNDSNFQMDTSIAKSGQFHQTGKHKYTTRRYATASSRLFLDETVRRREFERRMVGRADKANVRSIIMLPRAVLLQSQYKSPSAGLYLKSKMAEIPVYKFRIFRPNMKMATKEIEDLKTELAFEDAFRGLENQPTKDAQENVVYEKFLTRPTHYFLSSDVQSQGSPEDTFRAFLNAIIPRTRTLVRWMRPSIEHLYSLADIVATLEPFMIESNDITFKQYVEINYYVKSKIRSYRAFVERNRAEFKYLRPIKEARMQVINRLETMLNESREYQDYLLSTYQLVRNSKAEMDAAMEIANAILSTSSETLQYLLSVDGAAAYSATLNIFLMQTLTIPEAVVGILKPPAISSEDSKAILKSKCGRQFITKKYHSVAEMRKHDNTPDVFYDKEYDDTPYYLLDKYKDEKKRFSNEEDFREFFTETLIQKHDCPRHLAAALSNDILSKKKRVRSGEYAMLEIKPTLGDKLREAVLQEDERREVEAEAETRKVVEFYKRVRDTWELDNTITMDAFTDTNTLFCELSETCNKITEVNQCVPSEMAAMQMRLSKRARMIEEFEDRVARSFDEVSNELQSRLSQMRKQIRRNAAVLQTKLYRQNNYSYELGKYAISTDTVIESPHIDLRERILAWPDFAKKQSMIYTFCVKLCREPKYAGQEDEHWMYCKDTNTKLFPMSLFRLARSFIVGQTEYMNLLDVVIRENGTLSDDGDAIVDKHSGYVLRKIDYSAEEGFDESGFRIVSNAIVEEEQDIGAMVLNVLSKKNKVFDSPEAQSAYNVFLTLSENMGIGKDEAVSSIEEFVMRVSVEILNDPEKVMREDAYNAQLSDQAKRQTKKMAMMPYTTYFNQLLITIVGCATLAAMQTMIPSFKTKKTFPGCVKSFAGYPLDAGNTSNDGGLRYVACVLNKSKSNSSKPWSAIEPLSVDKLLGRLKTVMRIVYDRPDVAKLYEIKREYLQRNPEKDIADEVSVSRWVHFQPPVIVFKMDERAITGISEEFEKELFKSVLQGSAEQFKHIGIVKGKLMKHAYAVFELIDQVVRKKHLLLSSSAGVAFLENACCNEDGSKTNPLHYFEKERPELLQMLQKTRKMESVLSRVQRLSKAKMLFDPKSTRLVGAAIPDTIISKMIYETFIHYGNFDNDAPIPSDLLPLIAKKPEYNRFASLDEKIAFMKRHGKQYGLDDFNAIMRIVNGRNMVYLKPDKNLDCLGGLSDMLDYFDEKDSNLVERRLRELLRATIEEYDPTAAVHEERPTNRKLNRYLQRANEKMREVIMTFLETHTESTDAQLRRTDAFLKSAASWRISDMPSVVREFGNMVYNLAKVYPNKIIANKFQSSAPSHWDFSAKHKMRLEESATKFYAKIAAMVDNNPDSTFSRYLRTVVATLTDLVLFLEQIPRISPLVRDGTTYWPFYTNDTVLLLHEYCMMTALHEYIVLANDREFVQMRAEEIKETRRSNIEDGYDPDDPFAFDDLESDMPEGYGAAANRVRQVHIVESDLAELKKIAAQMLSAMIDRERESKQAIDRDYATIMHDTMKLKYKDKERITNFLRGLSRDERRAEQALRSHKLGRWNVGMQKGLYQYNKDIYDNETEEWHANAPSDPAADTSLVMAMESAAEGQDVEDLERMEEQERSAEYDRGDNGWDQLDEDYTDGIYYEEDAEREDYDEY